MKQVIAFVIVTTSLHPWPLVASAQSVPGKLSSAQPERSALAFLDSLVAEAEGVDEALALARAGEREQEAAIEQARAGYLPSVTFNAQTGPSKTWQWNEAGRVNQGQDASWTATTGVAARQNLWSGGVTRLRVYAARTRGESSGLETERRRAELRVGMARDLAALIAARRAIVQREELLAQARALEDVAQRKTKSGFLGPKELQETRRETLRASLELDSARLEFEEALSAFNRDYRQRVAPIDASRVDAWAPDVAAAAAAGTTLVGTPGLEVAILERNLELRQQALAVEASDTEALAARRQAWAPSLDVNAGLTGSRIDNGNVPPAARAAAPDSQLNAYATLSFSLALFSPEGSAASQTAAARRDVALARRAQADRAARVTSDRLRSREVLLTRQLENRRKLVAASEDLRDKNRRLFEAGEFDVVTLVQSQQDVALQKQAELEASSRLEALGIEALGAAKWGVVGGGATGNGVGGL
jgi:outer membrane protein TolC